MSDLTRWNRAGLSRFEYLDGNAAVFLERLRYGLYEDFKKWRPVDSDAVEGESEEAKKKRLEDLYASNPDDMLWHLTRAFARACHVLGAHIDAYANEGYLGTATQWENLRRLVTLLDYAPIPPASASTPLALMLKEEKSGTIAAGLQVKYSPASGSPVVFETLAELEADAEYNALYAAGHDRNPNPLTGTTLTLEGQFDQLKSGEPLLLVDDRDADNFSAHLVQGLVLDDECTTVTIAPQIPAGFVKGYTVVHIQPKERLTPIGPATEGVDKVGNGLQLSVATSDLAAGDIVVIRSANDKPYYRRIKTVHEDRLVFYRPIDQLTLTGATVARPVTVPITDLANAPLRRQTDDTGTVIDVLFVAGDWSRLAGQWLCDIRVVENSGGEQREYLPVYLCTHANYVPVGTVESVIGDGERAGYTALTLTWHKDTDGVSGNVDLSLDNPQTLLAPPSGAGPWTVDSFLNKSADGHLSTDLVTKQCKQTAIGDFAVVVKGAQMAWSRLTAVTIDLEHEEATLSADGAWRDRGGGPFFLSRTGVYSHFQKQVQLSDWQKNITPLFGARIVLDSLPSGLKAGRALIVDNGGSALETSIADLSGDEDDPWLELADALPAGTQYGNLEIYANVVEAGHGETRAQRVLGSGDGTQNSQRFTLEVADLSFVADAGMSAGVRADLVVTVADETWTQVANLKDSSATDAHYQVRIDQDGYAGIQFGDGRNGRRLPTGGNNVRVSFRQGSGAAGNLDAGSLVKPVKPHPLIDSVLQAIESSGGADRESDADLRENAPATLLALDRAVSLEDFSQLARGHASVWQARAFRKPTGLGQRERLEVVVMAAGGGTLGASLKSDLEDYLLARAQPGVSLTVTDYVRLTFKLTVKIRIRSEAYDSQTVQAAVAEALNAAFTEEYRQLGQALYRGDIYRIVDGVSGVENSDCSIAIDGATAAKLTRLTRTGSEIIAAWPAPEQCLVFDSAGFTPTVEEYRT
ncbi:MAG: putative baseplate assembly protein [Betaproteobacteria bacterium]|nr:putative baseplate assembly protein [Betaproteobacteria bacterium]